MLHTKLNFTAGDSECYNVSVIIPAEVELGSRVKSVAEISVHRIKGKSLVVLQVNCRTVYNKELHFWNLVDMYSPNVVIGMESWLKEDIGTAEVFRADFTTFRSVRSARGGGVGWVWGLSMLKISLPLRSFG